MRKLLYWYFISFVTLFGFGYFHKLITGNDSSIFFAFIQASILLSLLASTIYFLYKRKDPALLNSKLTRYMLWAQWATALIWIWIMFVVMISD